MPVTSADLGTRIIADCKPALRALSCVEVDRRRAMRKNKIVLFSKPSPIRSVTRAEDWTPESIADELIPAFRSDMARGDEVSAHVCPYDPI